MTGLYAREWRNAREKLTAEEREEAGPAARRRHRRGRLFIPFFRFLRSANAVLFGLSRRLAPTRRVLFGAALLLIFLSIQGPAVSRTSRKMGDGIRRTSEFKLYFDNGLLLASITLLTLLLAMELVDKINFRDELELARDLQSSLIPKILPSPPGYEIGAHNRIANTVGGDIYDFVVLPDGRFAVLFGDASGHGMTAGLVMAVAHAAFRTQLDTDPAPEAMFAALNRILCRTGGPRAFFGCVYLLLSPDGSYTGSVAGHPPVLRIGRNGEILDRVGTGAYPLGVKAPLAWATQSGRVEPGEMLLLHSDGLTEARDASGSEYGDARVEASVRRADALPAPDFVAALAKDLMDFCVRETPEDDVSIAAIRRLA
jgi:serine phosphatase RsbU (regulator of sigma subunit)